MREKREVMIRTGTNDRIDARAARPDSEERNCCGELERDDVKRGRTLSMYDSFLLKSHMETYDDDDDGMI